MLCNALNMPKYGLFLIRISPQVDKIADSVYIRDNTDTVLFICGKT